MGSSLCYWRLNEIKLPIYIGAPRRRYADFDVHPIHSRIIVGVVEVHGETVENLITVIDTKTKQESVIDNVFGRREHRHLKRWPDFVDNPRFSPDGKRLAFRAW